MPKNTRRFPYRPVRSISMLAALAFFGPFGCGILDEESRDDRPATSDTGSVDDLSGVDDTGLGGSDDTGPIGGDDTGESVADAVRSLDGEPDGLANDFIPDIPFAAPQSDDFGDDDGALISRRTMLLIFGDEVTVAVANDLLTELDAEIIGGMSAASLLYLRVPDQTVSAAKTMVTDLDPDVAIAALDRDGLTTQRLPPNNVDDPHWDWWWTPGLIETGEWGLKAVRAPQMWNLNDFVLRERKTNKVCAGVVELANPDATHPDLKVNIQGTDGITDARKGDAKFDSFVDHVTQVTGIIGARWDNNSGVEGINPWLETTYVRTGFTASYGTYAATTQARVKAFLANSCVKSVNESLGYKRGTYPADDVVKRGGAVVFAALNKLAVDQGRDDLMLVFAAGNSYGLNAFNSSEGANAAVVSGGRFLAVEAVGSDGKLASFSNKNGSISAPGVCIRSTEARNGTDRNFDVRGCVSSDGFGSVAKDLNYATQNGTSMAAPMVTGLATALWKLEPSLTMPQVRTLLTDSKYTKTTTGGAKPQIDAFAAAMGIDLIKDNQALQAALVDVDDGTGDGNLRERALEGELDPDGVHNTNSRRGDGSVNMRDFRPFRDAYVDMFWPETLLDGSDTHFKRDLNEDGCVFWSNADPAAPAGGGTPRTCNVAPIEDDYARYDFNGNGLLDSENMRIDPGADGVHPFKVNPDTTCTGLDKAAGCLRDIDVLADVRFWDPDPERVTVEGNDAYPSCGGVAGISAPPADWSDTQLMLDRDGDENIDYMLSADLHLVVGDSDADGGFVVQSGVSYTNHFRKCRHDTWDQVLTVPVFESGSGDSRIRLDYVETQGGLKRAFGLAITPEVGEDFSIEIDHDTLELRSTSRGKGSDVFAPWEQLESISADEAHGPFVTVTAATEAALEERIYEEANARLVPEAKLNDWLGSANLVVPGWDQECISWDDGECVLYEGKLWGALISG